MSKKSIIRHKFNGVTFHVDTEPFQAVCTSPKKDNLPLIMFPTGITNTKNCLCNIIHEAIHATAWDVPEQKVHEMGLEIGSLLWKLGFRLKEGD